jgi:molybdopterin biosynthesis enzyme
VAALTDVRGQGFDRLSPLAEAMAWIVAEARPLPAESVAPADAVGRVLAADVSATCTVPADDTATIDGFAINAAATVADAYGLGFTPLADERYDFVVPEARRSRPAVAAFEQALAEPVLRAELAARGFPA